MKEFAPKNTKKEKTVISIRIDTEMLNSVDNLSAKADISRNEFIVQCIGYAINNLNNM